MGFKMPSVVQNIGAAASKALDNPLGKLVNASGGGQIGAAASVAQGNNPFTNTPVGPLVGQPSKPGKATVNTAGEAPKLPDLLNALDPSGKLLEQYQIHAGQQITPGKVSAGSVTAGTVNAGQLGNNLLGNQDALNALKARAMATGNSPWLDMQLQKQKLDQTNAADNAATQSLQSAAIARNQLAMKGGLSGGARERIAMGSGRDINASRQGISRAGAMDRLNLGVADDQQKMQMLSQIPGMDLAFANQGIDLNKFNTNAALDASKFNVGNQLDASKFNTNLAYDASKTNIGNTLSADQFNSNQAYDAGKTNATNSIGALNQNNANKMTGYGAQMTGYAAAKQGDAIANGGKK